MSWKATFDKGVACFKRGDLEEALTHMNKAAELQSNAFVIYDSRAAVHEKLGNLKAALRDSKRVIDLAPDRWQGYARSARLFDLVGKYGSAVKMADHALSYLKPEDVQWRGQLEELREKAVTAKAAADMQRQSQVARTSYLLGKLPVETLVEIFSVLIDEDHIWVIMLSHVCGHWRQILLNTPSAWQTLVLSKTRPVLKAKLWKQRAKNRFTCISDDMTLLDRDYVFPLLRDLSWDDLTSLRMSGKAFRQLQDMLSDASIAHTFNQLREMTLFDYNSPSQLSCFLVGPSWKLQTLRLSGAVYMMDGWWERIQQLKELDVSGSLDRFSMLVFKTNPSLERLVFSGPVLEPLGFHQENNDDDSTSMENLKSIECRTDATSRVLRAITAPSITHFSMSYSSFKVDSTLLHIASCPSLVELHITRCSLDPSTLPMLFSSTPNLETLVINAVHEVVNRMFQYLTLKMIDPQQGLPCRALKHVDVSLCTDLTTSSVYAFVKTRVQHASESVGPTEKCAAIATLDLDGCPNIEPDMLPWFRSKVAQFSCIYTTKKEDKKNRGRYRQL